MDQRQRDHHANQGNPNNSAHKASAGNKSNQGNPNNSTYQSGRQNDKANTNNPNYGQRH